MSGILCSINFPLRLQLGNPLIGRHQPPRGIIKFGLSVVVEQKNGPLPTLATIEIGLEILDPGAMLLGQFIPTRELRAEIARCRLGLNALLAAFIGQPPSKSRDDDGRNRRDNGIRQAK